MCQTSSSEMDLAYYQSPLGLLAISGNEQFITGVKFAHEVTISTLSPSSEIENCITQLDEYFYAGRKRFTVNIKPEGSKFAKNIWKLLLEIPYGTTISYQELAKAYGNLNMIRAVGKANSKNPVAIIIPCHRVVGITGNLIGYAGGIENKKWLLDHEKASSPTGQLRLF